MIQASKESHYLFCGYTSPHDHQTTTHDTAKYNSVSPILLLFPLCPSIFLLFFSASTSKYSFWRYIFLLGLKQDLHLKFSFTKQKNILIERDGIKEKWFSMCPEAWHRQDLICYVQLESGLIHRDERGCLIKFTFHFLTWHPSPATHGTDGNAANNFCQNLVGETDWEMRRQRAEREKEQTGCFHLFPVMGTNPLWLEDMTPCCLYQEV